METRLRVVLAVPVALALMASASPAQAVRPAIAAGELHTVASTSGGAVWASGDNQRGQLGTGTSPVFAYVPVQTRDASGTGHLSGIVAVGAGRFFSLGLRADGAVWSWGHNPFGQLGIGTLSTSNLPVQVKDASGSGVLGDIAAIGAGIYHALAVARSGMVWAWGGNTGGQLGNGTSVDSPLPVQVRDAAGTGFLGGGAAVAGGVSHSLVLERDGTVMAFGGNRYGQLGDGSTTPAALPVQVRDGTGTGFLGEVVAIHAGGDHSVALRSDGTVWAWGRNSSGQLGNGTQVEAMLPVQVMDASGAGMLTDIVAIACGLEHSLALRRDGTVWGWGLNSRNPGALGDGTTRDSSLPVEMKDTSGAGFLSGVWAIAAGQDHSLALTDCTTVWATGWGSAGQLGVGGPPGFVVRPVETLFDLGPGSDTIPPDQGNVLSATRQDGDVLLSFPSAAAPAWRVYADGSKRSIGATALRPDTVLASFLDPGAVAARGPLVFYGIKGLSPCTSTPGP